ncbi:hypothetical protein [Stackebrandtia soli]|uniref:hypothetical protein n=1 Tax=Stackebrandtia soli TaxID=1892856 RepID=UPI0039E93A28
MTYPPPPGPPGSGGWPDDPTQAPQPDPYNPMPGGYPQPDPYNPMPAADPYAPTTGMPGGGYPPPPGSDPYAPTSGMPSGPYSAPPNQAMPSGPYSAPQTGYMPQGHPGMPPQGMGYPQQQPPPQNNSTGWIVGGIVGVVVIALVVFGTLFATGAFDADPPPDTADPNPTSSTTTDPGGDPSPTNEPPPGQPGGTYAYQADLCDKLDYGAFNDMIELGDIDTQTYESGGGNTRCAASPSAGSFTVDTYWFDSPEAASESYGSSVDIYMSGPDTVNDVTGAWEEGKQGETEPWDDKSCDTIIVVRDGNATVMVRFWVIAGDKPIQQADAVAAVQEMAAQALAKSAA